MDYKYEIGLGINEYLAFDLPSDWRAAVYVSGSEQLFCFAVSNQKKMKKLKNVISLLVNKKLL